MTTLTIKVPGEAKDRLSAFVKELGGEIVSEPSKKSKLLKEIKQGLKEVKKIREGKSDGYTMADLFDE
jgi:hypothetical protein